MDTWFGKKKRKPGGALGLYTTKHGATQRYAERIAEPLDALVKDAAYMSGEKAKSYDAIVVGCCVYEGRVRGLDGSAEIQAVQNDAFVLSHGSPPPRSPE